MKISKYDCMVLTYTVPHRKTYDVLCLLKASGYNEVLVWAVPLYYKKKFRPLYEHRPPVNNNISTKTLCENFGYEYIESVDGYEGLFIDENTPILYCGAGLIPDAVVKKYTIINAHPGYIPLARGLDALKWEIIDNLPIGVTTHIIGDEIDAGIIIERREIPIYKNDTFHLLAQRVYDAEVNMLVEAIGKYKEPSMVCCGADNVVHKRMGADIEEKLLAEFEKIKISRGLDS